MTFYPLHIGRPPRRLQKVDRQAADKKIRIRNSQQTNSQSLFRASWRRMVLAVLRVALTSLSACATATLPPASDRYARRSARLIGTSWHLPNPCPRQNIARSLSGRAKAAGIGGDELRWTSRASRP